MVIIMVIIMVIVVIVMHAVTITRVWTECIDTE